MSAAPLFLALDQGTTSTRCIAFQADGHPVATAQIELPQIFPRPGWVEHDPERLYRDARACLEQVAAQVGAERIAGIGVTNQRETTLLWRRADGRPLHNAIVWQDRRTAEQCDRLRREGHEALVQGRSGLLLDPYFSATKLGWMLDEVPGARAQALRGELAFGTVDTWLIWRLTGGRVHVTDASNASRTALFDLERQVWDHDLLRLFDIPPGVLPEVRDSAGDFGTVELWGRQAPIRAVLGDQQAATFGQAALQPGMAKGTYGTGAFLLLNTGAVRPRSQHRLLATVAWRLAGRTTYALEAAIFMAGATVQWLRDGLGIIGDAKETEALAGSVADTGGVYLVPAFAGLGAPYWDATARGALLGLTRGAGRAHIVRAALEAVAYQTRDAIEAMAADGAPPPNTLRVDGGLTTNRFVMQALADQLGINVERPTVTEATARGVAWLAACATGATDPATIERAWQAAERATATMPPERRAIEYAGWRRAVRRTLTSSEAEA